MNTPMNKRFRGYLPIIVDIETSGVEPQDNALLEIAAISIDIDDNGLLQPGQLNHAHITPFEGAEFNPESMKLNGIVIDSPFRYAISEHEALMQIFAQVKQELKQQQCQRAVLVGHNAWFDLLFLKAAVARCQLKKMPFHAFTCFDTATLAGVACGQTVLAKACHAAKIHFDANEAHSAIYDAKKTAELFCHIVNQWPHQR